MSELVIYILKALFGAQKRETVYHIAKKDVDIARDVASGIVVTPSTSLNVDTSGLRMSSTPKASSVVSKVQVGTSSQIASNYAKGGSRVRVIQ